MCPAGMMCANCRPQAKTESESEAGKAGKAGHRTFSDGLPEPKSFQVEPPPTATKIIVHPLWAQCTFLASFLATIRLVNGVSCRQGAFPHARPCEIVSWWKPCRLDD